MLPPNQNQLAAYLTAGLGAGCLAATADPAIVTFTGSGSFVEGTIFDVDVPTTSLTLPDASVLEIDSDQFADLILLYLGNEGRFTGTGTSGVGFYPLNCPGISLLGRGDLVFANPASPYPFSEVLVMGGTPQADFVGDVSGYIGFITKFGNKGWLKVAFNSTTGLFSYDGGAVATAGEELTAGSEQWFHGNRESKVLKAVGVTDQLSPIRGDPFSHHRLSDKSGQVKQGERP
jgi:hypothetical protein